MSSPAGSKIKNESLAFKATAVAPPPDLVLNLGAGGHTLIEFERHDKVETEEFPP
jgi:hypothetical protein